MGLFGQKRTFLVLDLDEMQRLLTADEYAALLSRVAVFAAKRIRAGLIPYDGAIHIVEPTSEIGSNALREILGR